MNTVEKLEGEMVAVSRRVQRLELLLRSHAASASDEREAQRIAEEIGFTAEVLLLPKNTAKRRKLARALHAEGWPASKIARAMNCCERTAQRWVA